MFEHSTKLNPDMLALQRDGLISYDAKRDGDIFTLSGRTLPGDVVLRADVVARVISQMMSIEESLGSILAPCTQKQAKNGLDWNTALRNPSVTFYEKNAKSFNEVFFRKNLLKNLLAMSLTPFWGCRGYSGVDFGSGAGPMALAALRCSKPDNFLLIDESGAQLSLARNIIHQYDCNSKVSFVRANVPSEVNIGSSLVAMASYWASEAVMSYDQMAEHLVSHQYFLIVDDHQYVNSLINFIPQNCVIQSSHIKFEITGSAKDLIEGWGGQFGYIFGRGIGSCGNIFSGLGRTRR